MHGPSESSVSGMEINHSVGEIYLCENDNKCKYINQPTTNIACAMEVMVNDSEKYACMQKQNKT